MHSGTTTRDQGREPTMSQQVRDAIGEEPFEAAIHRANDGSLDAPDERTDRYDAVDDLPDEPLGGWESLTVFTETHVYRWVGGGGYNSGPTRSPRDPEHAG